jgi:hypothetical protein
MKPFIKGIEFPVSQDYVFLEETMVDRMTKSTLLIRKSEARHFGTYNCTAINSYGLDSVEINLVADSKYEQEFIKKNNYNGSAAKTKS